MRSRLRCGFAVLPRYTADQGLCHMSRPAAVGKRFKQRDNKTRVRFLCGAANSWAWRSASPEAAGNHEPLFQQHRSKVSPRFSCLIRNLAPLPLSSVACGLLPKRSPPSSELGASHCCASAPITSGPLRRRTKGPPRPQPWRNSISMKAAQAVSGARAGSQQLSLGGADASNVFHLRRTRTNAARRSAR
jgi:hypothetical protein